MICIICRQKKRERRQTGERRESRKRAVKGSSSGKREGRERVLGGDHDEFVTRVSDRGDGTQLGKVCSDLSHHTAQRAT
jgi:hypothetical protein